jgi:hypothetical protein
MPQRLLVAALLVIGSAVCSGCGDAPAAAPSEVSAFPEIGSAFDAGDVGSVSGRVVWRGSSPEVAPFRAPVSPLSEQAGGTFRLWPNPHAPRIDKASQGVAGAVVSLEGVDPRRARPWDLPAVKVVHRDYQLHVVQGERGGMVGFVRRGDAVEFRSEQAAFHSCQARGAGFFTLILPDESTTRSRRLDEVGEVELSSAAGYFWMRAHLFVVDHPYHVCTDGEGRFRLEGVPSGDYVLTAWLADWREAAHELDSETCLVTKLRFRAGVTLRQKVAVRRGGDAGTEFVFGPERFTP